VLLPASELLVSRRLARWVDAAPEVMGEWEWLKWLPHALSHDSFDAVGPLRLISDDLIDIEAMFGETLTSRQRFGIDGAVDGPHVIIVLDGGRVAAEAQLANSLVQGVTVLDLGAVLGADPANGVLRLELGDDSLTMIGRETNGADKRTVLGVADTLMAVEAEALARRMTPLRISAATTEAEDALSADLTLPDLLRLGDPYLIDTDVTWRPRAPRDRLRVPIGVGIGGQPVDLDIKESAQGGMGPHGLVIGATGSGKSELLRTLVLGLALTHSSETLNFVLVDFKGGATFASLDVLPHTSAVITNLEDELILVDRMRDAVHGELVRRQEALRTAGNYSSLRDYERAREQGVPLEPMPSLFVIVDEFSELLSAKPDFIDLFVISDGWEDRWGYTSCWPLSAWRRASCAAWTPTCLIASGCGPSPRWRAAWCSGSPMPTNCRAPPATGTSRRVPTVWCGSRRPTSRGRTPIGRACRSAAASPDARSCRINRRSSHRVRS